MSKLTSSQIAELMKLHEEQLSIIDMMSPSTQEEYKVYDKVVKPELESIKEKMNIIRGEQTC